MLKFRAVAEKTAKNFRGQLFWPHPVNVFIIVVVNIFYFLT